MVNQLIRGNCIDVLKTLPSQSVDATVTDPPFFLKLDHYCTRTWFRRNFADLGMIEPFFKDLFEQLERVMKPDGKIYMFCDGQSYSLFWFHLVPFTKSVRPLVWDKKTAYNGYSWRHQFELIIFAEMSKAKPVPTGDGDILRFNAVKVDLRIHPAEKPVELLKALILKSTKDNDVVLDPFCGCGSTLQACVETNRCYIGIENEQSYYELAKKRVGI